MTQPTQFPDLNITELQKTYGVQFKWSYRVRMTWLKCGVVDERSLQGLEVAVDSIYLYYNMHSFHVESTQ